MPTTINIYLTFQDNCEEAFTRYKEIFGGEFTYKGRFSEMPPQEGMPPIPNHMQNRLMHISLAISEETMLMGSDSLEGFGPPLQTGNNFSISIRVDSKTEADRIFSELAKEGKVTMPLKDTFWGSYFGSCTDKFGINWMMNVDLQNQ